MIRSLLLVCALLVTPFDETITTTQSSIFALAAAAALIQSKSKLANTRWKLRLDVGLEPGTWMPKRFPHWAESGARLGLDVDVEFTNFGLETITNGPQQHERMIGPLDDSFLLEVRSRTCTFVSERGQESVVFTDGGWCVQRPVGDIRNEKGGLIRPPGLLRFWLDCRTGAKRNDVEIPPRTRIFFSTGLWDNDTQGSRPNDNLPALQKEYQQIVDDLNGLLDRTRQAKKDAADAGAGRSFWEEITSFRNLVGDSKEFDRLKARKETLEKVLPPPTAAVGVKGDVRIAPKGSLVIKGNNIPDWLPGSEYLILGTFSTRPIEETQTRSW